MTKVVHYVLINHWNINHWDIPDGLTEPILIGGAPPRSQDIHYGKTRIFVDPLPRKLIEVAQTQVKVPERLVLRPMISSSKLCPIQGFPSKEDVGKEGGLKWYCAPESWKETWQEDDGPEGKGGWWNIDDAGRLMLAPPAKKDFWRKTYYQPLLVKDDGSFLYATVPTDTLPVTIQTTFSLTPQTQFDQAGIIIRVDKEHWIKTGIEVVDKQPRLSCVVTNGFSDWSTQTWSDPAIQIRVHILPQHGGSFVVEASPIGTEDWSFIRIAHMNADFNHDFLNDDKTVRDAYEGEIAAPGTLMVGVFAACPVDQAGMVATFTELSITQGSAFVHDA